MEENRNHQSHQNHDKDPLNCCKMILQMIYIMVIMLTVCTCCFICFYCFNKCTESRNLRVCDREHSAQPQNFWATGKTPTERALRTAPNSFTYRNPAYSCCTNQPKGNCNNLLDSEEQVNQGNAKYHANKNIQSTGTSFDGSSKNLSVQGFKNYGPTLATILESKLSNNSSPNLSGLEAPPDIVITSDPPSEATALCAICKSCEERLTLKSSEATASSAERMTPMSSEATASCAERTTPKSSEATASYAEHTAPMSSEATASYAEHTAPMSSEATASYAEHTAPMSSEATASYAEHTAPMSSEATASCAERTTPKSSEATASYAEHATPMSSEATASCAEHTTPMSSEATASYAEHTTQVSQTVNNYQSTSLPNMSVDVLSLPSTSSGSSFFPLGTSRLLYYRGFELSPNEINSTDLDALNRQHSFCSDCRLCTRFCVCSSPDLNVNERQPRDFE